MDLTISEYPNITDCKDIENWGFNNLLYVLGLEGMRLECILFGNKIQIEDEYYERAKSLYFLSVHYASLTGKIGDFKVKYPAIELSMFSYDNDDENYDGRYRYWGIDILVCDFVDIEQIDPFDVESIAKGVKVKATLQARNYNNLSPYFIGDILNLLTGIRNEDNLFNVFGLYAKNTRSTLKEFINYSIILINTYSQNGHIEQLDVKKWFKNWVYETTKDYDDIVFSDLDFKRTSIETTFAKVEEKQKKVGRPKGGAKPLHEEIYKEFLRLTLSNDKTMKKPLAITRLTTSFGDKFKTKDIVSIKSSINRIIRERVNNN
ncbi:MAG: hypothetical protein H7339_14970 [Arcicella sp.]|nr:hypothetical protein [Arcicella sp.]